MHTQKLKPTVLSKKKIRMTFAADDFKQSLMYITTFGERELIRHIVKLNNTFSINLLKLNFASIRNQFTSSVHCCFRIWFVQSVRAVEHGQWCVRSLLWTSLVWRVSPSLNANELLHWVHLNSRSFKCTERLCFDRLPFSPNALSHSSHLNERSFRCTVLMCFLRSALCAKQCPHCVHVFRIIRDCTLPPFGEAEEELSKKFKSSLLGAMVVDGAWVWLLLWFGV